MKQIIQNIKNGKTSLYDVPAPSLKPNNILIKSTSSLISSGTEKMLVDFGKANIINKIRKQPDKVKLVISKLKTDGIKPTIESVFNKLDEPIPLGYCNVGKIIKLGELVKGFKIGDRVVSNGFHAEVISSSQNLCTKIPDKVSDNQAVFTILGSIALQGIRLSKPTLGEKYVVMGAGLVGLLVIQLLLANGCSVLAIDYDESRLKIAKSYGAEIHNLTNDNNPSKYADVFSNGNGVDAVILAVSTRSNEPVQIAARICRKRGRVILIGEAGLNLIRDDFYKKEIFFQVSSSYGPGRYEKNYEDKNVDYPIGFVRWTANRNFQSFLEILNKEKIDTKKLISHEFSIENSLNAYDLILSKEKSLGIIIGYQNKENIKDIYKVKLNNNIIDKNKNLTSKNQNINFDFIGAGNYSTKILMPLFKKNNVDFKNLLTENGVSSSHYGLKYNFTNATTNHKEIFNDKNTNSLVIASRHDSHFDYIKKAINFNKNIFVEKPLCLKLSELETLKKLYFSESYKNKILMIGFNRRFSPLAIKMKKLLDSTSEPKSFIITVNAGELDKDNWILDDDVGGGRLISEGCHFIDFLRYLSGSKIINWKKYSINSQSFLLNLEFADNSIATINYFGNGSKDFQKERIEVFVENKILQLNNFKNLIGYGWSNFNKKTTFFQDKGQKNCINTFINSLKDGSNSPIPFEEIYEVMKISIEASKS